MKFKLLQNNLRKTLWERFDERVLTGLRLAQQTGFRQAHISNFLNKKRGLSLGGVDKVLSVQQLFRARSPIRKNSTREPPFCLRAMMSSKTYSWRMVLSPRLGTRYSARTFRKSSSSRKQSSNGLSRGRGQSRTVGTFRDKGRRRRAAWGCILASCREPCSCSTATSTHSGPTAREIPSG